MLTEFNDFLSNPIDYISEGIKQGLIKVVSAAGHWILMAILNNSYTICVIICLGSLTAYIIGYKKAGKWVGISFMAFFVMQCLKAVFE